MVENPAPGGAPDPGDSRTGSALMSASIPTCGTRTRVGRGSGERPACAVVSLWTQVLTLGLILQGGHDSWVPAGAYGVGGLRPRPQSDFQSSGEGGTERVP